ncbi:MULTISPECIES: hypothetical protein [Shewanella]|uniref:hypothetical protein n=1 Tax=Shewanella TaxID=22 RepID=UPI00257CA211|nr:hypothetical protein [Shewanella sp.]
MNRRFIFSACLLTLASCATTPSADIQAKRAQLEATTPVCIDEKDCKAKWEAAQLWIVRNAGFKLQIVTNIAGGLFRHH